MKDFYRILGINKHATADEIRKAFRTLARMYHPDVNHSPLAENRFKLLSEAYNVLSDPHKRAAYDQERGLYRDPPPPPPKGHAPHGHHGHHGHHHPGAGKGKESAREEKEEAKAKGASRSGSPPPGASPFERHRGNYNVRLPLSLEDAAFGGEHEISVELPEWHTSRSFHVTIPCGIRPGQKIRLQDDTGVGGGGAFDINLVVEIAPHRRFRLEGFDLHTELEITPWEAILGCRVELSTLDGRVLVQIPARSSSGRKIRLRGKGFPGNKPHQPGGDLLVELRIVVPDHLSDEEVKLVEELANISRFTPRHFS